MNLNFRRGRDRLSLTLARAGLFCVSATALGLSGCGGDSSNTATNYAPEFAAATAVVGQTSFTGFSPNEGGAVGPATLSSPTGSVSIVGSLFYAVDTGNNRILGFNGIPTATNTPASFVLGQTSFSTNSPSTSATGLAQPSKVSSDGVHLVVADANNNRVLIWNSLPTATGTPPDVVVGQTSFTSSTAGTTSSTLTYPSGAMIANGKLVVVDQKNNRVLVWNTVPTASGTPADVVLGQPDFTSNAAGYYTTDASGNGLTRLTGPTDVWTDGFRLLVSDSGNNRVLFWKQVPQVNDTPTDIIIGQTSVTRNTAGTTSTIFNAPTGVGSDGNQVYIADSANNRVLIYSAFPVATGTAADRVIGQGTFTASAYNDEFNNSTGADTQDGLPDANPTARTLHTPTGVFAGGGTIYVSDRDNNRILFFAQ